LVGRLEDGTPYFAPLGQLPWDPDEDRLKCHLCGLWFRFLGSSHLLRTHGWTLAQYREAFQLRGNVPTCSEQLSATHRAGLT
jgi:ROS/MUCR transcriptional regulator protein